MEILDLSNCKIDDSTLLLLGENLCHPRNTVMFLQIEYNPITNTGQENFLKLFLNSESRLRVVGSSVTLTSIHKQIIKQININRQKNETNKDLAFRVENLHGADARSRITCEVVFLRQAMQARPQLSVRPRHHIS